MTANEPAPVPQDFPTYRRTVEESLGRKLVKHEVDRARNGYSYRIHPEAVADLIRSGRQR